MNRNEFLLLLDGLMETNPGTLDVSKRLDELESWDSLAVVGLIALVDERFGLTLDPEAIIQCQTVGDLIVLLGDRIVC